ncbi:MAG: alkaline phosphatase family protein [Deltaproteobacteria bacterium]|nr:alkaline phosphatase family protein [Deltaproteobacteria bacterium]
MSENGKRKVVVIGLDGATLDIIRPLANRGRLPNLARIMKDGVHGELESTIHPITPQAWTSFLTGKKAGKHGILDFSRRKKDSYDIEFVNASLRKTESIFSILSGAGKKVGAIAIPFTFPPEKVNGFMLSGMDSPGEDIRAVYPDALYDEIKKAFGHYHIHLASPVGRRIDQAKFWKDIKTEDENRTQISRYLMQKYSCDLFMTVYNNTDRVAHQHLDESVYNNIQNGRGIDAEDLLVKTYENTDSHVGALISDLGGDTSVIIMSDHGSGPIKRVFFLNRWLEENGFLAYRKEKQDAVKRAVRQARFLAKRFLPRSAKNFIEARFGGVRDKVESMLSFSDIDWEKTKAYGFGMYGNIYVNLNGREPNGVVEPGRQYEDLRDQIIEKLKSLRDPDTGEKIVEKVYRREDLYDGPQVEDAPDLLIGWNDYAYYTSVTLGKEKGEIFGPHMNIDCSEYKHVGTHRLNGTFMAMGPDIKKGIEICGAGICDVAPTILYMLGEPIPDDMDGRVFAEIFEEDFYRDNPPQYRRSGQIERADEVVAYSDEESRNVAERLKGLGYL